MLVSMHKNKWTSNLTRNIRKKQTSMSCSYPTQRMFKVVLGGWFKTNHGCCRHWQGNPFLRFFVWFLFWLETLPKAQPEGPEGWVHITRSQFTNLEHITISESRLGINFKISTKRQLPNLQQTVANTILITNISNSNSPNKFWVGIFTRQGHLNQVY